MLCRHVDEIALVSVWMIRSGHARAVAQVTAALVYSGGLALACQVKNGMVVLGEALAGCPCYELIRCIPQPSKLKRYITFMRPASCASPAHASLLMLQMPFARLVIQWGTR